MGYLYPTTPPASSRARIARLLLAAVAVALIATAVSSASAATSVSVKPVADTWVNSKVPGANYGSDPALRLDGSPVWNSYLRFDLSSAGGAITRVQLKLYPNSSSKAGLSVHAVAGTSWLETTTTAANAPAIGAAAVSSGPLTPGVSTNIDVTSLTSGHGLVSLALTDNDATAISLASRESSHAPVLFLSVISSSPSPAASPTPLPTASPQPPATPSATPGATAAPAAAAATTDAPTATPTTPPTATTPTAPPIPTRTPPAPPPAASPVRATFYYPWFPEAWNQSGMNPFTHYHPSLGFYNGADSSVVARQIQAMQYGKISVGIASWWGQGTPTDGKFPMLLSAAAGTGFRWAFYYEKEGTTDPSAAQIASDLSYINNHYGSDPNLYKIDGRPVVFVYAGPTDGCGMADRWAQGNAAASDYIVLKVFPGYPGCASQPSDWHQYSPAVAEDEQAGHAFAISPGFWIATDSVRLARDLTRWKADVRAMVASKERWQLVTTFNEWGEGTAVESATEWATASGFGAYLDALHNDGAP